MRRGVAHQELTTPENQKILGTWTSGTWRGFAVEMIAAEWYTLRAESVGGELRPWHPSRPWTPEEVGLKHLMDFDSPLRDMLTEGRLTSGAIGGEHRRDLKEALIGGKPSSVPLVGALPVQAESGGANGNGAHAAAPAKRRGF